MRCARYVSRRFLELVRSRVARPRAALLSQSDILMPVMDGVELLSRIKADERLAPLPVLLCTGYEDDRLAAVCHKVGAEAVVRNASDPRCPLWRTMFPSNTTDENNNDARARGKNSTSLGLGGTVPAFCAARVPLRACSCARVCV